MRNRIFITVTALFSLLAGSAIAEEFNWNWDKGGSNAPAPAAVGGDASRRDATTAGGDASHRDATTAGGDASLKDFAAGQAAAENFQWTWDGKQGGGEEVKTEFGVSGKNDAAYQQILKENLALRSKISDAMKDEELARKESARLAGEVKDLEGRIAQMVTSIKDMQAEKIATINPDTTTELEDKLVKVEKEKLDLQAELARLQSLSKAVPVAPKENVISEQSDLFRETEKQNMMLKKKLQEIEAERRRIQAEKDVLAKEKEKAASEAAASIRMTEAIKGKLVESEKQKRTLAVAVGAMNDVEKDVMTLKKKVSDREAALEQRSKEVETLKSELETRDFRLTKAERVADRLEQAREEVRRVNDREKRDMHYNMAVVYMKEGRFRDAEAEYLKALRLDPADADVHYNLGILYDDELEDKVRAVIHYRRYLALRPNGPDVDQVKAWLLDIEMKR
jgi:tetratricopeptide (TPR) repeat protein